MGQGDFLNLLTPISWRDWRRGEILGGVPFGKLRTGPGAPEGLAASGDSVMRDRGAPLGRDSASLAPLTQFLSLCPSEMP